MLANIHEALVRFAVPIESLEQHPQNPKEHDEDAIRESLILNGQYSPVLFQSDRNRIFAGHGTWNAALSLGWTHIAAIGLALDDDETYRRLLRDNRSHEKGANDPDALLTLLRELEGEFAGSGFNAAQYNDLLAVVSANDADAVTVLQDPTAVSNDLRSIILTYDVETFDPLIRKLSALQQTETETFTEVVQRLVAQAKSRV